MAVAAAVSAKMADNGAHAQPRAGPATTTEGVTMLPYFAYGSNMSSRRLRARVPEAAPAGTAALAGYRLAFVRGAVNDGSGKCNLCPVERDGARTHGALWRLPSAGYAVLDEIEGVGYGYRRVHVEVQSLVGRLRAFTYVAEACDAVHACAPYDWYLDFVIHGAREHGLPWEYLTALAVQPVRTDPDIGRAQRERAVLAEAVGVH